MQRHFLKIGGAAILVFAAGFVAMSFPNLFAVSYDRPNIKGQNDGTNTDKVAINVLEETPIAKFVVTHTPTPEPVKAIYMSQCVAGTPSFRDKLVNIADTTEVNSIVIDVKDYSGKIGFLTDNPALSFAVSDTCRAPDIAEFIDRLHKKGIYVIGRITVFQDPFMSARRPELAVRKISDGGVWKDNKGLSFIDVGAREHWDYIVELSRESYKLGFDELNYDYIRFPSDGPMADAFYSLSQGKTKPAALEEFFAYLHEKLKSDDATKSATSDTTKSATNDGGEIIMSADLFGMTTTNSDDLNIGQVLEKALPYFDYIAPMVYPSHYPPKFNGWPDPNDYPYELIKFVMAGGIQKANVFDHSFGTTSPQYNAQSYKKLRPWLQDFDYGGTYDIAEVRAQKQGTYDVGLTSWMLWAPSNLYTVGALDPENLFPNVAR